MNTRTIQRAEGSEGCSPDTRRALGVAGRQLAGLVTTSDAGFAEPTFGLPANAASEFAALVDYCREYREVADLYTGTNKLQVFSDLQANIDALSASGVARRYGTRSVTMRLNVASESIPGTVHALYIRAFLADKVPGRVAVSRQVRLGFWRCPS